MGQRNPGSGQRMNQPNAVAGANPGFAGGAGPYHTDLVPAFQPPEYVEVIPEEEIYQVQGVEPIPAIDVDLTVTSNDTEEDQEAEELEMPADVLAQVRMIDSGDLRSDLVIQVDQLGRESRLYSGKNSIGEVQNDTPDNAGEAALTELYQHEGRDLHFTVVETGGDGTDISLTFAGYKYVLSDQLEPAEVPAGVTPWTATIGPVEGLKR